LAVPEPDRWLLALELQHAQGSRVEEQLRPETRLLTQEHCGQDAQEVPV
jgi:hypothetical protein